MTAEGIRRWGWAGLAGLGILAIAGYVYRPWIPAPFDIWDFREFVPVLRRSDGAVAQLADLLAYYASHGRQNALFYATFVLQWHLFGEANAGWQLVRFGVMAANLGLAFLVLRRLGVSRSGALAGTGLLVAATPVVRGWVQLMAEPQALLALLLATLLAINFQETPRWRSRAVGIALLVGVVGFSKEVLVVLGGLVVLLACCRQADGTFRFPARSPRNFLVAGLSSLVVLAAGVLLLAIRHQPGASGYGMAYGQGDLSLSRFLERMVAELLPFRTGADVRFGLLYPANLLGIGIVTLGWTARWRDARTRRRTATELAWILAIPVIGAVAYLPWPKYDSFYALPFFFGSVLLFACAVTALEARGDTARRAVRIAAVLAVGYLALAARRSVAVAHAALQVNVSLARNLTAFRSHDTVVVAGPRQGAGALPVAGFELREYAIAMRFAGPDELPVVMDVDCEGGRRLAREGLGRKVLVSYSYGCGLFPEPSARLAAPYAYPDWLTLRTVRDSAVADLLVPR